MSEFKDDDEDFFGADGGSSDSEGAVNGINLSDSDLITSTAFKDIPVGTWLHVKVYDVTPNTVKSGNNYGKPKYMVSLMTTEDETEYGTNRKFTVFANMWSKVFPIVAYPLLKSVGMAPTKEQVAIGAHFSGANAEEYPEDFPLTDPKQIPAGSYVFPAPTELVGKRLYAQVGEYSGDNSGFKKFASKGAALAHKDDEGNKVNTRAYPQVTQFMSEEDYGKLMAQQKNSMGVFKGDA